MLLFFKVIVPKSCSGQFAKATPQSGSPKLLPKAVLQSTSAKRLPQSGYAGYTSNLFPKASLQSGSRKLLPKVTTESCSPKLRSQRCSPKLKFFKAAVQSCSSKLLPKAAPQSCSPMLLHKVVAKSILQSYYPNFFLARGRPFGGFTVLKIYSFITSRSRPHTRGESIRG